MSVLRSLSLRAGRAIQSSSPAPRRWVAWSACVAALAALQLGMTWGKLDLPFTDGALHYNYDNAYFTYLSRNGIRAGVPQAQLGLTRVAYTSWGVPAGPPSYYAHHPFLMKAAFQLCVRAFGDAEWVSRAFALGVSFAAAVGVLVALWLASGSLAAAALGAAVLVCLPVFARYQACLKYELDGLATAAWFFVATAAYLRRPRRGTAAAVGLLAAVSAVAHWTGLLFVVLTAGWLGLEWLRDRRRPECARAADAAATGAGAGLAVLAVSFAWLSGGVAGVVGDLGAAAAKRSDVTAVSRDAWLARQREYVAQNFGLVIPWVAAALGLALAIDRVRGRSGERPTAARLLGPFLALSLATASVWQVAFTQGSFVHDYWQLWFGVPVAALVTAAVAAARRRGAAAFAAAALAAVALTGHLYRSSRASYDEMIRGQIGDDGQLAFLRSLRHDAFARFVFVATDPSPVNAWFNGPSFEYYTDRPVVALGAGARLQPGDKVLVLRYAAQERVAAAVAARLGADLVGGKCGPGFCAYDYAGPR